MRVGDHLRLLRHFYPTWDQKEAARLLDLFGLDPKTLYRDLPKDRRTLENLAVALAHHPRLLLLDEPFIELESEDRRSVSTVVLDHLRKEGRADLFVTQSVDDAVTCADRIAVLQGGRVTMQNDLGATAGVESPRRAVA